MVGAYVAASRDKVEFARIMSDKTMGDALRMVVKPPRPASGLRKTGALLILAPDPITAVPGVAMLAASFVMKRREAAGLEDLVKETQRTMRELKSLF
jgi:hypothetical protein